MKVEVPTTVEDEVLDLPGTTPLYYEDPYLRDFKAEVLKVVNFEDKLYIVLDQTYFFPEGGGQLGDIGVLTGPSGKLRVVDTQTVEDIIVHVATPKGGEIREGNSVRGSINWDVRYERMRHHTGSHVLFSAIKRVLGLEELMYMGVQIKEDASRIDINYGKPIPPSQLREIERLSNRVCLENRGVKIRLTTRDEAERTYGNRLGITEVTPSGMVRVVEVEDWDVALCSGTHVRSTAEIGLIKVLDRFRLQRGVERIEFTAGKSAYEHYDKAIGTLTDLAQMIRASTKEVVSRVKFLLEERDDLKRELKRVREQLIESRTLQLLDQAEALGEFRLLKNKLPEMSPQSLKRVASLLVKEDPYLIAVLGTDAVNKAFLVGAAGEKAVEGGINMAEAIREAAQVIQGGGGGTPRLAQAGGRDASRLGEALCRYAEEVSAKLRDFP